MSNRCGVVLALGVLLALVATAAYGGQTSHCKIYDFSKSKCVEDPQKTQGFNYFEIFAVGVTESTTPELRCHVFIERNNRPVKGAKVILSGSVADLTNDDAWNVTRQKQKTNVNGRAWFYWAYTNLPPFHPMQVTVKAAFKGKTADCVRLACYFGYTDPIPVELWTGRYNRFGHWSPDASCTALQSSVAGGMFDCADGLLTIDLEDNSSGFPGIDTECWGTTLRYDWSGNSTPPMVYFTDRARGICEWPIWARVGAPTYQCTAPW